MSLKETLKSMLVASSLAGATVLTGHQPADISDEKKSAPAPQENIIKTPVEDLEKYVADGELINGKNWQERKAELQKIMDENGGSNSGRGRLAALEYLKNRKMDSYDAYFKEKDGSFWRIKEENGSRIEERYYPNGVLQSRSSKDKTESFYPNGAKRLVRDETKGRFGVEETYHPGEPGKEKLRTTPHDIYEAFDELDKEGRRIAHHHEPLWTNEDMTVQKPIMKVPRHTKKDTSEGFEEVWTDGFARPDVDAWSVNKVDLYDPETQKEIASYTLRNRGHMSTTHGQLSSFYYMDENGKKKEVTNVPERYDVRLSGLGDGQSLSLDELKMIDKEIKENGTSGPWKPAMEFDYTDLSDLSYKEYEERKSKENQSVSENKKTEKKMIVPPSVGRGR